MNNIAQHFATAFLGKYPKRDAGMDSYRNLVEYARDGQMLLKQDRSPNHRLWMGVAARGAVGLRLEQRAP